jgi:16S rRNA processing protein RimM
VIEIASLRPQKDMFVARIKGVDDRNAAEALRNLRLYVPRERLGKTGEDEFFHADLIGLAVSDTGGAPLGRIVAVENFGAGDLIEIAPPSGASFYLPFTKRAVPLVDIAGQRVVVDPPPETDDGGPEVER